MYVVNIWRNNCSYLNNSTIFEYACLPIEFFTVYCQYELIIMKNEHRDFPTKYVHLPMSEMLQNMQIQCGKFFCIVLQNRHLSKNEKMRLLNFLVKMFCFWCFIATTSRIAVIHHASSMRVSEEWGRRLDYHRLMTRILLHAKLPTTMYILRGIGMHLCCAYSSYSLKCWLVHTWCSA